MQEASGVSERAQPFVKRGVPYATELAQLTERHWAAGRFERCGDTFVDGDRDGDGFVRSLQHAERESGAVLLELDCEGGR